MEPTKKILIIGGYGAVGIHLTEFLVQNPQYEVTLAGRSIATAKNVIASNFANQNVTPLLLDIEEPLASLTEKLKIFDAVIVCIDQSDLTIPQICAELAIPYLDITATDDFNKKVEQNFTGKTLSSPLLFSVGLAPGLSNLLAKKLITQNPQTESVEISVLLGSGEKHGLAAVVWTLKELIRSARSGGHVRKVHYGPSIGVRSSFPFNFSDQHSLKRTYPLLQFTTRLSMESRFMNTLIQGLYHWPLLARLLEKLNLHTIAQAIGSLAAGSDIYAVKATAQSHGKPRSFVQLKGNGEGRMTGFMAALTLDKLLQADTPPHGVHHIHNLFSLEDFYLELQTQKCEVTEGLESE